MPTVKQLQASKDEMMSRISDLEAANAHPENPWLKYARHKVEIIDAHLKQMRFEQAV